MSEPTDDEVDAILQSLPPAPPSWVARAEELPRLERALGEVSRDGDELALRRALEGVGLEPDKRRLRVLARLHELRG